MNTVRLTLILLACWVAARGLRRDRAEPEQPGAIAPAPTRA